MTTTLLKNITTATTTNAPEAIITAITNYNKDKSTVNKKILDDAITAVNAGICKAIYENAITILTADTVDYATILKDFALTLVQVYKITYDKNTQIATIGTEAKALNFAKCDAYYRKKYAENLVNNGTSKAEAARIATQKTLFKNTDVLHMLELFAVNIINFKANEAKLKIKYTSVYKSRHPEKMEVFTKNATTAKSLDKQINAIKNAMGFERFEFNRTDLRMCIDTFIKTKINKTNEAKYVAGRIATLVSLIFMTAKTRINGKEYGFESKEDSIVTTDEAKKRAEKAKKAATKKSREGKATK